MGLLCAHKDGCDVRSFDNVRAGLKGGHCGAESFAGIGIFIEIHKCFFFKAGALVVNIMSYLYVNGANQSHGMPSYFC